MLFINSLQLFGLFDLLRCEGGLLAGARIFSRLMLQLTLRMYSYFFFVSSTVAAAAAAAV